jgi:hypothetical protein
MKRDPHGQLAQLVLDDAPALFERARVLLWWSLLPSVAFGLVFVIAAWLIVPAARASTALAWATVLGGVTGLLSTAIFKALRRQKTSPRCGSEATNR